MIKSLRIRNLATIDEIELGFKEGFSILTGETGAGKSIIIDGLRLVLGEKGSSDMIRTGKKEVSVEAIFQPPKDMIRSSDLLTDLENEMFVQRSIAEEGAGKGYINGILVPIKKMKEMSIGLVDIYGQSDHVFLRNPEYQLNYLDHYAGAISLRREISRNGQELRKLIREKRELENKEREREQRLDFLAFQIKEIEKTQLKQGEDEGLLHERNIFKNAEKISSLVDEALNISYNQENSISPLLSKLQSIVSELRSYDKAFKETEETLNEFAITIREFSDFLIKFKDRQAAAPEKLEKLEERLSQIEKLKRKYGNSINDILSHLKNAKEEYKILSTSQEKLTDLGVEIKDKYSQYKMNAGKLSESRTKFGRELEKNIEKEISLLGMKKARFKIKINSIPLSADTMEKAKDSGIDEVEFLISPNPGEELRPLRKIASGGELSRVMLALKTLGKEREELKTLIFDEIDSGIGGKTAEFVAQKLKELSKHHQVICITHLPQIASFATHHYNIGKTVRKERTFTTVKKLSFEERVSEISHLLAGTHITKATLQNAREMLIHNLKLNK
ncbi:MAG: DNA repair protein RecN [Candidatus Aminicenantes bacterium]|nr:MAG: DNA repair protein RecN [Candidatus Aminicenantes bacterium]